MFNYSIVYLMALFAFLLVDHWLLPWLQPAALFEFAAAVLTTPIVRAPLALPILGGSIKTGQ